MRKICVVIVNRANYSSIKSVLKAIKNHPNLILQIVAMGSSLLDRYGSVVKLIESDGFKIDEKLHVLIEGETPVTMAKSTGVGLIELPTVFERLQPDIVFTVGDRFETMSTTLAAAYMNITIAHSMGGEVSGNIDESIRHAVTKFSHIHFPASKEAAERISKLGERAENIYLVGCPRMDLVSEILNNERHQKINDIFSTGGVGEKFDLNDKFIIVSQHPVTTEYGEAEKQITQTLEAVYESKLPAIVLWPNPDAGSDDISRGIRKWREKKLDKKMYFFKNLSISNYINLMRYTTCLVGNSSSGIREGAFIGTPVVNIGTRQQKRERGKNVIDVKNNMNDILKAIETQIIHGTYKHEPIYGDGNAGKKIADILSECNTNIQKQITY